jgi:hypothetical protein
VQKWELPQKTVLMGIALVGESSFPDSSKKWEIQLNWVSWIETKQNKMYQ